MSNYEKYLQILQGAKKNQSTIGSTIENNKSSGKLEYIPLTNNTNTLNARKEHEQTFDFSRAEIPFNFYSHDEKERALGDHHLRLKKSPDKQSTISPRGHIESSLQSQISSINVQISLIMDRLESLDQRNIRSD